jgi:uncharacterized protein (UPF0548 family)
VYRRAADRLLRYDIFPPRLMRSTVCTVDGRVAGSATIVQRVRLPPGVRLEAAVRVVDVWRSGEEVGFRYVTLAGHPERGEESFAVRRDAAGVAFLVRGRSQPGTLATRLLRPLTRRFQRRATEAAVAYFCGPSSGRRSATAE